MTGPGVLPETDARAAIRRLALCEEEAAGRFERLDYHLHRRFAGPRTAALELPNGHHTDARDIGKPLLRPTDQSPSGSTLGGGYHFTL
jgi:hypothetical protein